MPWKLKLKIYKTMIRSVLLYCLYSTKTIIALKKSDKRKLEMTEMRMLDGLKGFH
jgi:hypothetical protein